MTENIFYNVNTKWRRAKKKTDQLKQSIITFCNDNPISLDAHFREGRYGVDLKCKMDNLTFPLSDWSIELGEIVYSLRSSLDNLIYVCAQRFSDPPKNPRRLQFPIFQDATQYHNAVQNIKPQLAQNIIDLLEKIQPFQRASSDVDGSPEEDPLVLLNWISNHDKHRMPVPFLIPPTGIEINHACQFYSDQEAAENVPPDVVVHVDPLSHGKILLEHRTKHPVKSVYGKFDIVAHVAFNSHNGVRKLDESMNQLTLYTKLIIDEFAKEFT